MKVRKKLVENINDARLAVETVGVSRDVKEIMAEK
jgi:hypothetical protein